MSYIGIYTHIKIIFFIVLLSIVGFIGLADKLSSAIDTLMSYPFSYLDVNVITEGNRFVLSRENTHIGPNVNILKVHNFSFYYGLVIVSSVVIATPNDKYIYTIRNFIILTLVVLFAQLIILSGFALDTSNFGAHDEVAIYSYSAWWTMGPVIIAVTWYWKFWRKFWFYNN